MVDKKNSFFDDSLFEDSSDLNKDKNQNYESNTVKNEWKSDPLDFKFEKKQPNSSDGFNVGFSFEKLTRYKYIAQIARGGMGVVYKVNDEKFNRKVALKVIPVNEENINKERYFQQEVKVLARFKHPNIVQIFDAGRIEDYYFFTMEYIEGTTFGSWLERNKSLHKILRNFMKVIDAVGYVHTKDVVHRDLKPENIMIRNEDEQPVLMDFGIAKDLKSNNTRSKTVGTPHYMSPEQLNAENNLIDHRSDIFSLGVILYEILTKNKPFLGNEIQVIQKVVKAIPTPPRHISSYISKDIEAICLKCLEKDPKDRYDSALALRTDVENYLNDKPILAKQYTQAMRIQKWIKRNRVISIFIIIALCSTVIFTFFTIHYLQKQAYKEAQLRKDKEASLVDSLLSQGLLLLQKCKAMTSEGNYIQAAKVYEETQALFGKISQQIKVLPKGDEEPIIEKWKTLQQIAKDIYIYEILPHPHKISKTDYGKYTPVIGRVTQMQSPYLIARKNNKFFILDQNLKEVNNFKLSEPNQKVHFALSANDRYLSCAVENKILLIDLQRKKQYDLKFERRYTLRDMQFSYDNKLLCGVHRKGFALFETISRKKIAYFEAHDLEQCAFSENNEILYVITGLSIHAYKVQTLLENGQSFLYKIDVMAKHIRNGNNNLVFDDTRSNIYTLEIATKKNYVISKLPSLHNSEIHSIHLNKKMNYFCSISKDGKIFAWNMTNAQKIFSLDVETNNAITASWSSHLFFNNYNHTLTVAKKNIETISILPKDTYSIDILNNVNPVDVHNLHFKNENIMKNMIKKMHFPILVKNGFIAYENLYGLWIGQTAESKLQNKHSYSTYEILRAIVERGTQYQQITMNKNLIISAYTGKLDIWKIKNKQRLRTNIRSGRFALHPEKNVLISSDRQKPVILLLKKNGFVQIQKLEKNFSSKILKFSNNGKHVLISGKNILYIFKYDSKTNKIKFFKQIVAGANVLLDASLYKDDHIVVVSDDNILSFYKISSSELVYKLKLKERTTSIKYDHKHKKIWLNHVRHVSVIPDPDLFIKNKFYKEQIENFYPLTLYKNMPFSSIAIMDNFQYLVASTKKQLKIIPITRKLPNSKEEK